jgi:hypothetical protein
MAGCDRARRSEALERLLGKPIFEFYAGDAAEARIHDDAMRAFSASHAGLLLDAVDFDRAGVVVDIGGGTGELLAAILAAHRGLHGVLYDLPDVVDRAAPVLREVADRCSIEAGSFFERVPGDADTYLLKHILHDWDDDRVHAILRSCRRCMPARGSLIVIERTLPDLAESEADAEGFLADLEMLVMTSGGRERTEGEFRHLLANAGFELTRIVKTASPLFVYEGRPS